MVFLGTFLAVVSVLFNIVVKLPLPLPVSYRLALSGVETAICGPPPVLPYLQLLCGTADAAQLPAAVAPSVVLNAGLFGAAVFNPALTGCLVNCTLVDEPAPVYFGPHLPPPGPLIVAPKFELLAPPTLRSAPFCPLWDRPFMFSDLLTLRNLVYLGIALVAVYTLWRSASGLLALKRRLVALVADIVAPSFYAKPTPGTLVATYELSQFQDYAIQLPSVASLGSLSNNVFDDFSNPFVDADSAQWEAFDFAAAQQAPTQIEEVAAAVPTVEASTDEDVASVAASDDHEPAAVDEEPLLLPTTSSPSVSVVSDNEPQAEVVDSSAVVDDALVEHHLTQDAAISDDVAAKADTELASPSFSAPVVNPDGMLVVDFEHSSALLEQDKFPQCSASPAEETGAVEGSVVDEPIAPQAPTADAVASSSVATATGDEQPVKPKRPTRSGRKCKALRRQREREAEAAAAAANPEAPQLEAVPEEPVIVEPDVVEEPLTREERRRQRKLRARAAAQEASSSSAVPEPEGPVFTDGDFPPLPVEPVTPKPLEHRMSYALVTAVSRPSVTAAIHTHRPPSSPLPVQVDAHVEPEPSRFKWIAASRQYEDLPQDSMWTNWTMDLEDMATFRYAKKTRRKKKD